MVRDYLFTGFLTPRITASVIFSPSSVHVPVYLIFLVGCFSYAIIMASVVVPRKLHPALSSANPFASVAVIMALAIASSERVACAISMMFMVPMVSVICAGLVVFAICDVCVIS